MVFDTGAKLTAELVEQISTTFISSGLWHNVDTTWNTTDKTDDKARRVLIYGTAGGIGKGDTSLTGNVANNSTTITVTSVANFNITDKIVIGSGQTAEVREITAIDINTGIITLDSVINTAHFAGDTVKTLTYQLYLAMEIINHSNGERYACCWTYGKGIRFTFSTSWNSTTHVASGITQTTFMAFESHTGGVPSDLATINVTYWLWIEDNGNGFVMMGKPEPSSSNQQQSFIVILEKIANPANKEYVDNQTDFFLYTAGNIWSTHYDRDYHASIWTNRAILRPFAYQWPDGGGRIDTWANGYGISFCQLPNYIGYKSVGNGKVYYIKPIINNTPNQLSPIFQSELFFMWSEGLGLIDGDVVAVQGQPVKFLCKAVDSPDSTNRLTYAIKYYG